MTEYKTICKTSQLLTLNIGNNNFNNIVERYNHINSFLKNNDNIDDELFNNYNNVIFTYLIINLNNNYEILERLYDKNTNKFINLFNNLTYDNKRSFIKSLYNFNKFELLINILDNYLNNFNNHSKIFTAFDVNCFGNIYNFIDIYYNLFQYESLFELYKCNRQDLLEKIIIDNKDEIGSIFNYIKIVIKEFNIDSSLVRRSTLLDFSKYNNTINKILHIVEYNFLRNDKNTKHKITDEEAQTINNHIELNKNYFLFITNLIIDNFDIKYNQILIYLITNDIRIYQSNHIIYDVLFEYIDVISDDIITNNFINLLYILALSERHLISSNKFDLFMKFIDIDKISNNNYHKLAIIIHNFIYIYTNYGELYINVYKNTLNNYNFNYELIFTHQNLINILKECNTIFYELFK